MKKAVSFVILIGVFINSCLSQIDEEKKKSILGLEQNNFITGSGFLMGTEILVSLTEGRRYFATGFYVCSETKRVTGIVAHHEIFLRKSSANKRLVPYAFYNGIFRITRVRNSESETNALVSDGTYKSLEHHIGAGMRVKMVNSLYLSASAGYGVYFGSIKRPEKIPVTNEVVGSNGFAPIAKIGIGFII